MFRPITGESRYDKTFELVQISLSDRCINPVTVLFKNEVKQMTFLGKLHLDLLHQLVLRLGNLSRLNQLEESFSSDSQHVTITPRTSADKREETMQGT